jgi:ornithine cyclodeaminase/alanine dehydrogenase-like protein (mu-crystallin family)
MASVLTSLDKYPHALRTVTTTHLFIYIPTHIMSNFRKFAIVGAGNVGSFIVDELLKQKAAGTIDEISIISRPVRPVTRPSSHLRAN